MNRAIQSTFVRYMLLLSTLLNRVFSVPFLTCLPSSFPPHHYTGTQQDTLSGFSSVFATPKLRQHLTPVTDIDDQFMLLEVPSLNVHDLAFPWFFSSPSDSSPSSPSFSSSPPTSFYNIIREVWLEMEKNDATHIKHQNPALFHPL